MSETTSESLEKHRKRVKCKGVIRWRKAGDGVEWPREVIVRHRGWKYQSTVKNNLVKPNRHCKAVTCAWKVLGRCRRRKAISCRRIKEWRATAKYSAGDRVVDRKPHGRRNVYKALFDNPKGRPACVKPNCPKGARQWRRVGRCRRPRRCNCHRRWKKNHHYQVKTGNSVVFVAGYRKGSRVVYRNRLYKARTNTVAKPTDKKKWKRLGRCRRVRRHCGRYRRYRKNVVYAKGTNIRNRRHLYRSRRATSVAPTCKSRKLCLTDPNWLYLGKCRGPRCRRVRRWNKTANYPKLFRVKLRLHPRRRYVVFRSLQNGNLGHRPGTPAAKGWWTRVARCRRRQRKCRRHHRRPAPVAGAQ